MDVNKLSQVLKLIGKELDYDVPYPALQVFLYVAKHQGCQQKDVEENLGLTNASASRNVSIWTDRRADRRPGFGFITRDFDPYDQRYRVLNLTEAGKAFYEKIRNL